MRVVSQIPRYMLKQIAKNYNGKQKERYFTSPVQQVIGEVTEKSATDRIEASICIGSVHCKRTFKPVAHHLWFVCSWKKFDHFDIGDVLVLHGKVAPYGRDRLGLSDVHFRHAHEDEILTYYTTLERFSPSYFST